jgi:hypothetical protein
MYCAAAKALSAFKCACWNAGIAWPGDGLGLGLALLDGKVPAAGVLFLSLAPVAEGFVSGWGCVSGGDAPGSGEGTGELVACGAGEAVSAGVTAGDGARLAC